MIANIQNPYRFNSVAWDINNLGSFVDIFASGFVDNNSVTFKPDGFKMYIGDFSLNLIEYDLSTAWDITSASLVHNLTLSESPIQGITFRESDGKKMYIIGSAKIWEYDLINGWDLTTATLNQSFTLPSYMTGIYIKQDGTTFYSTNQTTENLYEYNMSTPWDVSSSSLTHNVDIGPILLNAQDVFFKPDGTRFFVTKGGVIGQWNLSTPWDLTTQSFDSDTGLKSQGDNGQWWRPDGKMLFSSTISVSSSIISYEIH